MTLQKIDAGRRQLAGGLVAVTLLLASCGGGETTNKFSAKRVVAFGDETSLIVDLDNNRNGRKYSVNATVSATDPTIACAANPIWIQAVATLYGLVFPQCNVGVVPVPAPVSRIRAAYGARAADLAAQVDAQQAESALGDGDLVTVLVGQNDVLAQYARYPGVGETQLTIDVETAGAATGRQVNRLADAGAKVLIATAIDIGVTPFAAAEKLAHADTDRAALLSRLTARYNASLRATITNDGRRIGLVLLDEAISVLAKFPGSNGYVNAAQGACDLGKSTLLPPSLLDCTGLTLVFGASGTTYLWADDLHLSAGGQTSFANLATGRAQNNPF